MHCEIRRLTMHDNFLADGNAGQCALDQEVGTLTKAKIAQVDLVHNFSLSTKGSRIRNRFNR
jgi:hypothetical protein